MTTAKEVYDEVERICKDIEKTAFESFREDEGDQIFFHTQKTTAEVIRTLLSYKFPLL